MQILVRKFCFPVIIATLFMLSGCVSVNSLINLPNTGLPNGSGKPFPTKTETVSPLYVPQNVALRPLQVAGFELKVDPYRTGVVSGGDGEIIVNSVDFKDSNVAMFEKKLSDTLQKYGYTVADPGDNNSNNLLISTQINSLLFDRLNFAGMPGRTIARIGLSWTIKDQANKKIYGDATTGSSEGHFDMSSDDALNAAFSNALDQLLSKVDFIEAVMDKKVYAVSYSDSSRSKGDVVKSVVAISAGNNHGSGFVISPKGLILTNEKLVGSSTKVSVTTPDGMKHQGSVVASNQRSNVSLIQVPGLQLPALQVRKTPAEAGEAIYTISSTPEKSGIVTDGKIGSIRTYEGTLIQINAGSDAGGKGVPLLDSDGSVIGISSSKGTNVSGVYFFEPIMDGLKALNIQ